MLTAPLNESLCELQILGADIWNTGLTKAVEIAAMFAMLIWVIGVTIIREVTVTEMPAVLRISHTSKGMFKTPYLGSFKLHKSPSF